MQRTLSGAFNSWKAVAGELRQHGHNLVLAVTRWQHSYMSSAFYTWLDWIEERHARCACLPLTCQCLVRHNTCLEALKGMLGLLWRTVAEKAVAVSGVWRQCCVSYNSRKWSVKDLHAVC